MTSHSEARTQVCVRSLYILYLRTSLFQVSKAVHGDIKGSDAEKMTSARNETARISSGIPSAAPTNAPMDGSKNSSALNAGSKEEKSNGQDDTTDDLIQQMDVEEVRDSKVQYMYLSI